MTVPQHVPANRVVEFDILNPPELSNGFHEAWLKFHHSNPARSLWTTSNGGHWIVNDGVLVQQFNVDHVNFSSRITQVPRERSVGNNPIPATLDPPEHAQFWKLLNVPLSPRAAGRMVASIRERVVSLIEEIKPRGQCEFVAEFSLCLPLEVFMTHADLPLEDIPRLRELVEEKMRPAGKLTSGDVQQKLYEYLRPIIQERQNSADGDDLISQVLHGQSQHCKVREVEACRMCAQLLVAGLDTVASLLSFIFLYLARYPAARHQLIEDSRILPKAIEEFLRRFPLVTRVREVDNDYDCDGVILRKGDLLVLPTMLHGLDERAFPNPMDVEFDRPPRVTATFGFGAHRCPGAFIARTELKIVLQEWLSRIPEFKVADESKVRFQAGFVAALGSLPLSWAE